MDLIGNWTIKISNREHTFSALTIIDKVTNSTELVRIDNKPATAELLISDTHTNNQFANEPERLRHFRDNRWKALGEENPILSSPFLFRHYFESYIE